MKRKSYELWCDTISREADNLFWCIRWLTAEGKSYYRKLDLLASYARDVYSFEELWSMIEGTAVESSDLLAAHIAVIKSMAGVNDKIS